MASGAQRFVQQQLDRAARGALELPTGVVTVVSPLTVSFRGASLLVRRCKSYTPAVDDVVILARSGGTWVVLDSTV